MSDGTDDAGKNNLSPNLKGERHNLRTYRNKALVNLSEVTTHLHGYETEVVFLIDPGQEGLVLVVEDSTSSIPAIVAASITKHTACKDKLPLKLLKREAQLMLLTYLLKHFRCLYCKQYGPTSVCSLWSRKGSRLISFHSVCFRNQNKSEVHLNIYSRRKNQTFSGQKFIGRRRVNPLPHRDAF